MSARERAAFILGSALTMAAGGAAEGRSLEDILQSGFFDICVQEDNAPFSDQTTRSGIFIDIGHLIGRGLGVKLSETWLVSAEYARKTKCDAIPAVANIPNDDPLQLTIPYLDVRTVLVNRQAAQPVTSLDELKLARIAVLATSYARHDLNLKGQTLSVAFFQNAEVLEAVEDEKAAAGVVTLPSFEWYVHQHSATLRANFEPLGDAYDYQASLGLRRSDPELLKRTNEILSAAMADGSLKSIFAKYGLSYEAPGSLKPEGVRGNKAAVAR